MIDAIYVETGRNIPEIEDKICQRRSKEIASLQELLIREILKTTRVSERNCISRNFIQRMSTMETDDDSVIKEGKAEVYQPSHVFYNPVQEFNRDLTIAVISEFCDDHFTNNKLKKERELLKKEREIQKLTKRGGVDKPENLVKSKEEPSPSEATEGDCLTSAKDTTERIPGVQCADGVRILEGLAASGLRSIRFAKEVPGVKEILTNDFDKNAVAYIQRNVEHNQVESLVTPSLGDAAMVMYQHKKYTDRFDVVDLDPYGSPTPFLDATVQSVQDGGLLCVTCTDLAVMCGNGAEACFAKYGSMSLRCKFCHEMALRIVLQAIESHANRYSRYIQPLLCVSVDFYVRVFVKVHTGQNIVKQSITKNSMVYHCGGCGAFTLQPLAKKTPTKGGNFKYTPSPAPTVSERCEHCNSRHHIGGPIWSDPLYDTDFVKRVLRRVEGESLSYLGTLERIKGLLSMITEELRDVPFYYIMDHLFSLVHSTVPSMNQMRSAILNAGYSVSYSHAAKNSLKTTAPMHVLLDIVRCWVKSHPVSKKHLKEGTILHRLLSKEPELIANFDIHPDSVPESKAKGLLRWQINPERDWGPKARAKKGGETLEDRRQKGIERAKGKRQAKRKKNAEELDLKKVECKRLKLGLCDLGESCKYSHAIEDTGTCSNEACSSENDNHVTRSQDNCHDMGKIVAAENTTFVIDRDGGLEQSDDKH